MKYEVTEKNVVDGKGNPVPVGTQIEVREGESLPPYLSGKARQITTLIVNDASVQTIKIKEEELDKERTEIKEAKAGLAKAREDLDKEREQLEKDRKALADLEAKQKEVADAQAALEKEQSDLRDATAQLATAQAEFEEAQKKAKK